LIEQRLAPGLVFALGDVALGRQLVEHVELMLDGGGR
jgi:hypothetical protein